VPKPDSDDLRLIHDCSQPTGAAVNDYIEIDKAKFQTIDDALDLIKPGYYMAKIDLKSAYRSVHVHPSCYRYLGCKWQFEGHEHPTYFYDTKLPFGAKSSPGIFHRLTQSVRRMMKRRGFDMIIVYLDDFLIIGKTYSECLQAYLLLMELLQELGFQISQHKLVPPSQCIIFLGVEIDSRSKTVSLPTAKLPEFRSLLAEFLHKSRATKRQLQHLAGKLNWACRVVYGGRTFLRRILDTLNKLKKPYHKAKLSANFKLDVLWWTNFMSTFNGTRFFLEDVPIVDVMTDACPIGGGAFYNGDWMYVNWARDLPAYSDLHINQKETLAICYAAKRWAPLWSNRHVIIHTDNIAAQSFINKGTTRTSHLMPELRHLFWLSAAYNFRITARYVRGCLNTIADSISRLHDPAHIRRFQTLFSAWVDKKATPLSGHVLTSRPLPSQGTHRLPVWPPLWKGTWMPKSVHSGLPPSQIAPNLPTVPTSGRTSSSAFSWATPQCPLPRRSSVAMRHSWPGR